MKWRWALAATVLAVAQLSVVSSIVFDPCAEVEPIRKGGAFVVGLAFWPGGKEADWGDPVTGINPCNETHRANLTAQGVHFASYNTRVDKLSVLKTTFPEQLALTADSPEGAPLVISVVAFRAGVRSEPRYVVSGAPAITGGTGFVSTLSLMSKFETGVLKYLQFYNLTCNDCGGVHSGRCINGTSCTLPVSNCTCSSMGPASVPKRADASAFLKAPPPAPAAAPAAAAAPADAAAAPAPAAAPAAPAAAAVLVKPENASGENATGEHSDVWLQAAPAPMVEGAAARRLLEDAPPVAVCNYTQFSYCAASINFAYDGLDAGGVAFTTASQVRKLNSYSLVALFAKGKALFFDFKEKYDSQMGNYWGRFGELQDDVAAAYSGNAEAGRTIGGTL